MTASPLATKTWVDIAGLTLPHSEVELRGTKLYELQGYSELLKGLDSNAAVELTCEIPAGLHALAEPARPLMVKFQAC